MAEYRYPDDGKLHTRYSELVRCTSDQQSIKVAELRHGLREPTSTDKMNFGRERHEQFKTESLMTGRSPEIFKHELGFDKEVLFVEKHFAIEIFKNVVLHFTPDQVYKLPGILDFKTTNSDGRIFQKNIQLDIYAFGMTVHGHRIKVVDYLIEQYSPDRTAILGYHHFAKEIKLSDLAGAKRWARNRVERLWAAEDYVLAEQKKEGLQDNGALDILSVY